MGHSYNDYGLGFSKLSMQMTEDILLSTNDQIPVISFFDKAEHVILDALIEYTQQIHNLHRATDYEQILFEVHEFLKQFKDIEQLIRFCKKSKDDKVISVLYDNGIYDELFPGVVDNIVPYNILLHNAKERINYVLKLRTFRIKITYTFLDSKGILISSEEEYQNISQSMTIHIFLLKILRRSIDINASMSDSWVLRGLYPYSDYEDEYTVENLLLCEFEESIALKTKELIYGIEREQIFELYKEYLKNNSELAFEIICTKHN